MEASQLTGTPENAGKAFVQAPSRVLTRKLLYSLCDAEAHDFNHFFGLIQTLFHVVLVMLTQRRATRPSNGGNAYDLSAYASVPALEIEL